MGCERSHSTPTTSNKASQRNSTTKSNGAAQTLAPLLPLPSCVVGMRTVINNPHLRRYRSKILRARCNRMWARNWRQRVLQQARDLPQPDAISAGKTAGRRRNTPLRSYIWTQDDPSEATPRQSSPGTHHKSNQNWKTLRQLHTHGRLSFNPHDMEILETRCWHGSEVITSRAPFQIL
jgi:hypothetical protein